MNALSLYVTSTRMLFQAEIDDSGAWNDINRLMSYLRQSLTCCVCGGLLYVPMSSTVSSCQHHVCKSCVGGKMRLKPSCSWCKDHSKFIENIQLRILLQCYKQLASFILSSTIVDNWGYLACETNQTSYSALPNNFNGPATFRQLLEEGSNFHDKYAFSEPPPIRNFQRSTTNGFGNNTTNNNVSGNSNHHNYNLQLASPTSLSANNHSSQLNHTINHRHQQPNINNLLSSPASHSFTLNEIEPTLNTSIKPVNPSVNSITASSNTFIINNDTHPNRTSINNINTNVNRISSITSLGNNINTVGNLVQSITLGEVLNGENTKTGIILKAGSQAITFNRNIIKADPTQLNKILTGALTTTASVGGQPPNNQTSINRKVRRGCRCGLATPNPGKLTCCGQRCPCYVESKACNQCKCRGCHNPNKISNLTTINIISSGALSTPTLTTPLKAISFTTSTASATSSSPSALSTTSTTPSLSTTSTTIPLITKSAESSSSLISIPATNLFQIPITVKGVSNSHLLLSTGAIAEETLIDGIKTTGEFTLD